MRRALTLYKHCTLAAAQRSGAASEPSGVQASFPLPSDPCSCCKVPASLDKYRALRQPLCGLSGRRVATLAGQSSDTRLNGNRKQCAVRGHALLDARAHRLLQPSLGLQFEFERQLHWPLISPHFRQARYPLGGCVFLCNVCHQVEQPARVSCKEYSKFSDVLLSAFGVSTRRGGAARLQVAHPTRCHTCDTNTGRSGGFLVRKAQLKQQQSTRYAAGAETVPGDQLDEGRGEADPGLGVDD